MLIDCEARMKKLVLASSSPRRKALMKLLDVDFECVDPGIEESMTDDMTLEELAIDLARQKAVAVHSNGAIVLGCDTIVEIAGKRLGKPKNEEEARDMLKRLGGKKHRVITGCCLIHQQKETVFYKDAYVTFDAISDEEINTYIDTKEPFGKAGAYAIQGYGAKFITHIEGDYYSIMGLPVCELYKRLKELLRS